MKLSTYTGFAHQADQIGINAASKLAERLGVAIKVIACFVKLYTGK